ncbi:MAG: FadR family transcriptional regulator [Anaerolineales bacterium]|nr:FadR family transcriptional regulator [Anaerolineales bacterium]
MQLTKLESPFLKYIIAKQFAPGERLPTLNEISDELGVSIGKLREQLEVARSLGLVSVRPRLGIQREVFDFNQIVLEGMLFSLATEETSFKQVSQLRQVIEIGFWHKAVVLLTSADKEQLRTLIAQAWLKLRGEPAHIPNSEHRAFHLTIYSRLDNPFVQGLLSAYWDAYDASELTRFASYDYWIRVWTYHERIVAALCDNNFDAGLILLQEHFALLRPLPTIDVVYE